MGDVMSSPEYLDFINPYLKLATWSLHFCLLPRKCVITDKILWFTHAYKGRRVIRIISDHDNFTTEFYYMGVNEYLIWTLKHE